MASRWAVDPRRSRASFMARQLGMTIKGTFMCIKGELAIDREALERSTAHVVIDATSLETALPGFGAILEAKDFLDVEHHPTIEFRSGAISRSTCAFETPGAVATWMASKPVFPSTVRAVVHSEAILARAASTCKAKPADIRGGISTQTVSGNIAKNGQTPLVTVSVEEAPEAGLGLKLAVAPAGRPPALSVTAPLKPPVGVILTV